MRKRQPAHFQHVVLSQRIKQFLCRYKVSLCLSPYTHPLQSCNEYHSRLDRRRMPYREEALAYYPSDLCSCKDDTCLHCHNHYERYYHPLAYKTAKCGNYSCTLGLYCYFTHGNEEALLARYQFFRFELQTFKTELCPYRQQTNSLHELASCHYYHNESDRRRNPRRVAYSHVQCGRHHCQDPLCASAHNKIQQLYHPSRYKTKYCQGYINKKMCQYNEYCSFAHSDAEIKIELLHEMTKSQDFYDYKYKTIWCPYTNPHDRGNCSYAHNFQDYRRDPKKIKYSPEICPNWTKGEIKSIEDSGCPLRMDCPKSHGWLEKKYHPDRKKWEAGQAEAIDLEVKVESKEEEPVGYVLGAPFFKQQGEQSDIESQSLSQNIIRRSRTTDKNKQVKSKDTWQYSFFLPENETCNTENNENQCFKTEYEASWESTKVEKEKRPRYHTSTALTKSKISKRHKAAEYTKSLKNLLVIAGLEQKLESIKVKQVKLLSLEDQEVDKLGLEREENELLIDAIREYSRSHKLDKVHYTDSMVRIFRNKKFILTLEKMRKRGIDQKVLQALSSSSIEDLSFLEEDEKTDLPKVLDVYADTQAYRELETLINKHTEISAGKPRRGAFSNFKS